METIKLNDGNTIPRLGIGVYLLSPREAEASIITAIGDGYRLVDTANAYQNEIATGRAIRQSGVARGDIFLSTKLWPSIYAKADEAIDETLSRLGTSYVDLLFLHQPAGNYLQAYKAMEQAHRAGKIRSLGLSNFSIEKIREVLSIAQIKPAVLQVEAHPYYPQKELKKYLASFDAKVMAWYPLGHGDKRMFEESTITKLVGKYHKSPAQIILRWHLQEGNIIIPGSKNPDHIHANADIFDFRLTEEEMTEMASLDKGVPYYVPSKAALDGFLHWNPAFDND